MSQEARLWVFTHTHTHTHVSAWTTGSVFMFTLPFSKEPAPRIISDSRPGNDSFHTNPVWDIRCHSEHPPHFLGSPLPLYATLNTAEPFSPAQRPFPIAAGGGCHSTWFTRLMWRLVFPSFPFCRRTFNHTLPIWSADNTVSEQFACTATCTWPTRSGRKRAMGPILTGVTPIIPARRSQLLPQTQGPYMNSSAVSRSKGPYC